MKIKVRKPTEVEVLAVRISIPLRYDDDGGMAKDFPLRVGQRWSAVIDIATGAIRDFPSAGSFEVYEKVCDEGRYALLGRNDEELAVIDNDYVPKLVPNDYGDYVDLKIVNGIVKNWPRTVDPDDIECFFVEETFQPKITQSQ